MMPWVPRMPSPPPPPPPPSACAPTRTRRRRRSLRSWAWCAFSASTALPVLPTQSAACGAKGFMCVFIGGCSWAGRAARRGGGGGACGRGAPPFHGDDGGQLRRCDHHPASAGQLARLRPTPFWTLTVWHVPRCLTCPHAHQRAAIAGSWGSRKPWRVYRLQAPSTHERDVWLARIADGMARYATHGPWALRRLDPQVRRSCPPPCPPPAIRPPFHPEYFLIRTEAVAEIPLRFYPFHLRFLS
jgi:hypothetical protein